MGTAVWNLVRFWSHERVGIEVADGVDEVAVALTADALARTYRSEPVLLAATPQVTTRGGLLQLEYARP